MSANLASRQAAVAGAGGRLVPALTLLTVIVLFGVSGGMLWTLGLNYDGVSGSAVAKIHPATYLGFLLIGLLAVWRDNPASLAMRVATRYPGALVFATLAALQIVIIAAQGRPNLATAFDTYLLACFMAVAMGEIDAGGRRRIELSIHILMAANAALALLEFATDQRFFPYRFEGEAFELDTRSAALHGHPLVNAAVTGCYVLALMSGGGPALRGRLRISAILAQFVALVTFGGRTALILVALAVVARAAWRALAFLRGARVPLGAAAALSFLLPLGALALGGLYVAGFFDAFLARFGDDGGSAQARVGMFELFSQIPLRDLVVGPSAELVDSIRRTEGLDWGIENPVVRMLLYQGIVVTALIVIGFTLFMVELGSRIGRGSWTVFAFFLVTILSFESLASKTTLLAKFVVLVLAMYPAVADTQRMTASKPRATRRGLSSVRAASSV